MLLVLFTSSLLYFFILLLHTCSLEKKKKQHKSGMIDRVERTFCAKTKHRANLRKSSRNLFDFIGLKMLVC